MMEPNGNLVVLRIDGKEFRFKTEIKDENFISEVESYLNEKIEEVRQTHGLKIGDDRERLYLTVALNLCAELVEMRRVINEATNLMEGALG